MSRSVTLDLADDAVAAFARLQAFGLDPVRVVERALTKEAARIEARAEAAARLQRQAAAETDPDTVRDLPRRIEFAHPPR